MKLHRNDYNELPNTYTHKKERKSTYETNNDRYTSHSIYLIGIADLPPKDFELIRQRESVSLVLISYIDIRCGYKNMEYF